MNNKDKQILEKAYAELSYKNRSDIESTFLEKLDRLQNKPETEKTALFFRLLSPQSINEIQCLGIYEYLLEGSVESLFDSVYTTSRLNYRKGIFYGKGDLNFGTGGYDCTQVKYYLHAFAANDVALGEDILKKYTMVSRKGHRFLIVLHNILYAIYLSQASMSEDIEKIGNTFLSQKNPEYEKNVISFLMNLVIGHYQEANNAFAAALGLYKKNKSLHDFYNDLNKFIAIPLLGIYSFLRKYLNKEKFQFIQLPETETLPQNVLSFKTSGKNFVTFKGRLDFLQRLIDKI